MKRDTVLMVKLKKIMYHLKNPLEAFCALRNCYRIKTPIHCRYYAKQMTPVLICINFSRLP